MKPTQELIWALRRAAKRVLDRDEPYDWGKREQCNCGLLIREVLGISAEECDTRASAGSTPSGTWSIKAHSYMTCKVSGIPVFELFDRLIEIGFEPGDIRKVEYLMDDEGRELYGSNFDKRSNVADYFGKLADSLELQLKGTIESRDPISTEEPTRARIALEGVEA